MAEKPILGHRIAEGERREQIEDYALAFRSVRAARAVFLTILLLSLLINLAAYCGVRWGGVLAPTAAPQDRPSVSQDQPATDAANGEPSTGYPGVQYAMQILLPLAEFLGPVSCVLLALCFLLATNISLSGGLGGARGSISAFFWALVLLALIFPWGRWFGETSGLEVPGVYLTYSELRSLPVQFRDITHEILHYVRFLGYPVLAVFVLLAANARFIGGYRLAQRQVESRLTGRV